MNAVVSGTFSEPAHNAAEFTVTDRPADSRGSLECWLAIPRDPDPDAPPLVAVHGILRNPRDQARLFGPRAATQRRIVIAPLFDKKYFRGYQRVIMRRRADLALLALLDRLEFEGLANTRCFDLFGYSGGAQFAHRFAMLYPHRVNHLTVLAAGWYTFPDDAPFPYGLSAPVRQIKAWGPHAKASFSHFLRLQIQVCVGDHDDQPDENTLKGVEIDRQQGTDRLTRATNWTNALIHEAISCGIDSEIKLSVLPGCGHDFRECVRQSDLPKIVLPEANPGNQWADTAPQRRLMTR